MAIEVHLSYTDIEDKYSKLPTCLIYPHCKYLAKFEKDNVPLDKQKDYEARVCLTSPHLCEG